MSKYTPLSGYPEFLPADRNIEREVIARVSRVFELHGFANIETRAPEPLEVLQRKGEIDKEIYVLRRLHADSEGESGDSGLGLHYDLTVPFARYVLEHAGKLEFPFRRYQVQKAWRGERPQEGRYREFTQADIDVVAKDELAFHYDVEVARVMAEALADLPLYPLTLRVNNRKLIEGFYLGIGAPDAAAVMRIVDKLDKVPRDAIAAMLVSDAGLSEEQADTCLALADIAGTSASVVDKVRALGVTHELLDVGLDELAAVIAGCEDVTTETFKVQAALNFVRGLDYYTGTVFEIMMAGFESLGSVGGGGRYDALASDGRTTYPGVGISFGISRTIVPLVQRGLLESSRSVPSAVLVALANEESRADSNAIAQQLRQRGIPAEVVATAQKYGRQIRYAERRGIPWVWFPATASDAGEVGNQVKDIRSGEQFDADPASWSPPAADLRPTVSRRDAPSDQRANQATDQEENA